MSDKDSNSVLWFLAGLGVGAVVGVLYAPSAGSEIRENLRSKADEGREFVKERTRKAREQASDLVDRGRDVDPSAATATNAYCVPCSALLSLAARICGPS